MDAMVHGKWSYHVRYGDALGGDLGGYLKLKKKTGQQLKPFITITTGKFEIY